MYSHLVWFGEIGRVSKFSVPTRRLVVSVLSCTARGWITTTNVVEKETTTKEQKLEKISTLGLRIFVSFILVHLPAITSDRPSLPPNDSLPSFLPRSLRERGRRRRKSKSLLQTESYPHPRRKHIRRLPTTNTVPTQRRHTCVSVCVLARA